MKQLVAAVVTLTVIVAGIVVATSLSSAAQEDGGSDDTTTTTVAESEFSGRFGFRFGGEVPPELADLEACLTEQGIDIPEDLDRGFMFEFKNEEGLAEALEACGLPAFGDRFPFGGKFQFGGDLPPMLAGIEACLTEQGIEIPDDSEPGFLFDLKEEDIESLTEALEACGLDGFGDGFPFGSELPDGVPFGGGFDFRFGDELPDGFPFGGDGFDFRFGGPPFDLDELAACLSDLGSFDSVDEVRDKLEECLPAPAGFGGLDGLEGIRGHGRNGFGFHFDGHGPFGFDLDDAPDIEGTST